MSSIRWRGESSPKIVGISGSLRDGSHTRQALTLALEASKSDGGTVELLDLRELRLPVFDSDRPNAGDSDQLRDTVRRADAVLLATPMYHGSFSGSLKNALDYCGFDEFEHTTVGLLAVSGGPYPSTALNHLRVVCRSLHAWVLPDQVAIPNVNDHFDGDQLVSDDQRDRVRALGGKAVTYSNITQTNREAAPTQDV